MTLWLLRPVSDELAPWDPWFDKCFGFVIRAETEAEARKMAQAEGSYETRSETQVGSEIQVWTDPALVTCVELKPEGEACIIISDFHAA